MGAPNNPAVIAGPLKIQAVLEATTCIRDLGDSDVHFSPLLECTCTISCPSQGMTSPATTKTFIAPCKSQAVASDLITTLSNVSIFDVRLNARWIMASEMAQTANFVRHDPFTLCHHATRNRYPTFT